MSKGKWESVNIPTVEVPRWPAYNHIMDTYGRNPAREVRNPRVFYDLHQLLSASLYSIGFKEDLCLMQQNGRV